MCDCKDKCETCEFTACFEDEDAVFGPSPLASALAAFAELGNALREIEERGGLPGFFARQLDRMERRPNVGPTEFKDAEPGPLAGREIAVSFDGADLTDDKDAGR